MSATETGRRRQESSSAPGGGQTTGGLYGSEIGTNVTRPATAELFGTFILVFVGISVASAALLDRATAGAPYDSLSVALAFGGTLAALAHISGAHLNPAVTVALAATGKFPPTYAGTKRHDRFLARRGTGLMPTTLALILRSAFDAGRRPNLSER